MPPNPEPIMIVFVKTLAPFMTESRYYYLRIKQSGGFAPDSCHIALQGALPCGFDKLCMDWLDYLGAIIWQIVN